jgi:hypothetical protein
MSALPPIATAKADIEAERSGKGCLDCEPYAPIRGTTVGHEERILFAVALPPPSPVDIPLFFLPLEI